MSIKQSNMYVLAGCVTAFIVGSYTTSYLFGKDKDAASPDTVPDFDLSQYREPWYEILMSNDLPFFVESCA